MAVYKQIKSGNWSYRFRWNGEEIRKSTKQTNKRVAVQMEAAHKTSLAKGMVGIRETEKVPTLTEFSTERFLPQVREEFSKKPKTLEYYENGVKQLLSVGSLANRPLDEISTEHITGKQGKNGATGYVAERRQRFFSEWRREIKISTLNRELQVLRRMFARAKEWAVTDKPLPMVKMLHGENHRDRVLSRGEGERYLNAATEVGESIIASYEAALVGTRARRGQLPIKPADPFLLRDVTTLLVETGMRPEECFRLRWEYVRDGAIHVPFGKTENARRSIPLPQKAAAILEMRATVKDSPWVFPAPTKSAHMEKSTIRRRHRQACTIAEIEPFPLYTFRHTCLTRWAKEMDPYTLAYLAGHSDFSTTKRYVHPEAETVRAAMDRAGSAKSGHTSGHTSDSAQNSEPERAAVIQ